MKKLVLVNIVISQSLVFITKIITTAEGGAALSNSKKIDEKLKF